MIKNIFWVYVLKDENNIIRYVGKTNDYKTRISSHFKNSSNYLIREKINDKWSHDHIFNSENEIETLKKECHFIDKYKKQLYNIRKTSGISRRSDKITLTLKNIKNGEIRHYFSQREAALDLGFDSTTISCLVRGKRNHVGGIWTLENINPSDIIINPRKKGYLVDKEKNYFKLFDSEINDYVIFKSVTDCSLRIGIDTTSICMLRDGRINCLKRGRYKISPDVKVDKYKKMKVLDMLEDKILEYKSRVDFCKDFNFSSSTVSSFTSGKIKILKNRFKLIES
jgi:predicted GIY-YIG superfamily endonuclease